MGHPQTATSSLLLLATAHFCEVAGLNAIQRCSEAPDRIHLRAYEAGPPWPCPPGRGPVCDIGSLGHCSSHRKSHATEGGFKYRKKIWFRAALAKPCRAIRLSSTFI